MENQNPNYNLTKEQMKIKKLIERQNKINQKRFSVPFAERLINDLNLK